jgi:hypothetical protein
MNEMLKQEILRLLVSKKVIAADKGDLIAVNRDSMCNSDFACKGLPEETVYPAVLDFLREQLAGHLYFLYWSGKTDDDYFLSATIIS